MRRLLFRALFALLLAFTGASAQKAPPGGAKPPARPTYDPVIDLQARVEGSLKVILGEMSALRAYYKGSVVGKGYGEYLFPAQEFSKGYFKDKVPASLGEEGDAEATVKKALQSIKQNETEWKAKRTSTVRFASSLYGYLTQGVDELWRLATPVYEVKVLQAELDRDMNGKREVLRNDPRFLGGSDARDRARRFEAFLDAIDAAKSEMWSEYVGRVRLLRQRVDKMRKKWGRELWLYYDFAEAKSASPNDGHAAGKNTVKASLDYTFTSRPRPIDFDSTRNNGLYIDTRLIAYKDKDAHAGSVVPFEAITGFTEPDLQVFKNGAALLSVNMCLEPPVEKLRGYVEPPEPPAITDTFVLPVDSAGAPGGAGRTKAFEFEGSAAYYVFAYGPKLPTKLAGLRIQGPDRGILYEPVAVREDAGRDPTLAKRLSEAGLFLLTSGHKEPQITDLKALPWVVMRVRLTPGILPGRKTFTMNGAAGGWYLDQGTSKAQIRILRELNDSPTGERDSNPAGGIPLEPAKTLVQGTYAVVEVRSATPLDAKAVAVVLGRGKSPVKIDGKDTVPAIAVPGEPGVFRTQRIRLVEASDPLLDPANAKEREPETIYMPSEGGQAFHAHAADPHAFHYASPFATATVWPPPVKSLWLPALQRAAKVQGKELDIRNWNTISAQTAKEESNVILTQIAFKTGVQWIASPAYTYFIEKLYGTKLSKGNVVVSTKITIGNHAAMLLMRDRFVGLMRKTVAQLDELKTPELQLAFLDGLGPAMEQIPLGDIQVYGNIPDSKGPPIPHPLKSYYSGDKQAANEKVSPGYIRTGKLNAFKAYRKAVGESLERAEKLEDKDIDGLLALTGNGFSSVVEDLKPMLLRPVTDPRTKLIRWVTDYTARAEVMNLHTTFEAVRAQKEYSAIDTQVVLAVVSLAPVALPGGIAKAVISIAVDLITAGHAVIAALPDYFEKEQEFEFSRGAFPVLGSDRYYMADMQRTSAYGVGLNLVLTGLSLSGNISAYHHAVAEASKQRAALLAKKVTDEIQKSGPAVVASLKEEELAAFILHAGGLEIKEAQQGAQALSAQERQMMAAFHDVKTEATKKAASSASPVKSSSLSSGSSVADANVAPFYRPVSEGPWIAPTKDIFELERLISKDSAFFDVWKVKGNTVLKILKSSRRESAEGIWEGIQRAQALLEKYKIPHLKMPIVKPLADAGYIVQEFLPFSYVEKKEAFIVYNFLKRRTAQAGEIAATGKLTPEMDEAIIGLIQKMKSKNLAFEDFKFDNIYIKRITEGPNKGKLEAGVLDVDRISLWGKPCKEVRQMSEFFEMGRGMPGVGVKSLEGGPSTYIEGARVISLDEFWLLTLERRGMIKWNEALGAFEDGDMAIAEVAKVLPGVRRKGPLDLSTRTPAFPPALEPPFLAWFRPVWHTLNSLAIGRRPKLAAA